MKKIYLLQRSELQGMIFRPPFCYCKLNFSRGWYRLDLSRISFPFEDSIRYTGGFPSRKPLQETIWKWFGGSGDSVEGRVVTFASLESAGSRVLSRSFDTTHNDSPEERSAQPPMANPIATRNRLRITDHHHHHHHHRNVIATGISLRFPPLLMNNHHQFAVQILPRAVGAPPRTSLSLSFSPLIPRVVVRNQLEWYSSATIPTISDTMYPVRDEIVSRKFPRFSLEYDRLEFPKKLVFIKIFLVFILVLVKWYILYYFYIFNISFQE